MGKACAFDGCPRPLLAKGWCSGHYQQAQKGSRMAPLFTVREVQKNPAIPGTMLVPLTQGTAAVIDEVDAVEVGKHSWGLHRARGSRTYYAASHFGGKTVLLHVFIAERAGIDVTNTVDHENTDGLDCRRDNLRAATWSQNQHNRGVPRNNTSGYKGVCWNKRLMKWQVAISVRRVCKRLGYYTDLELASFVYKEAAHKFHGSFARVE